MARKTNKNDNAIVQVYERELPSGAIRFCLHYTLDGERTRETLKDIPIVFKSDRQAYKESRAIAERIAAERITEIRNGELGFKNRHNNLLLSDWLDKVAEDAKKRERPDLDRHNWARKITLSKELLIQYAGDKVKLHDIDRDFLLGFLDYLRNGYIIGRHVQNTGKHLSPVTANDRFKCLNFALKQAVREGLLLQNPCDTITDRERIKPQQKVRCFLTVDELRKLENTPTGSNGTRRVYLFMCYCGLRISDCKSLRWSDIQEVTTGEGKVLVISKVLQKTQKPLYLPLNDKAAALLPEREGAKLSDLVFSNLPTEPAMNRALKTWAEKAGIGKEITLHTARHTNATLLLSKGVNVYTVKEMLGHTDVKTTQIYAHMIDEEKLKAAAALNNL